MNTVTSFPRRRSVKRRSPPAAFTTRPSAADLASFRAATSEGTVIVSVVSAISELYRRAWPVVTRAALALGLACIFACAGGTPTQYGDSEDLNTQLDANRHAQTAVKKYLQFPRDAEFGWNDLPFKRDNGTWGAVGTVKALNVFGARVTHEYRVVLALDAKQWKVASVTIDGELAQLDESAVLSAETQEQRASQRAIAEGYQRGENDLEGNVETTPKAPVIAAAKRMLTKHFKKRTVKVTGDPEVSVQSAGQCWIVSGIFEAPEEPRTTFTVIVSKEGDAFTPLTLMLDDDTVIQHPSLASAPREGSGSEPESPQSVTRMWTSASGGFSTEAEFAGAIGDRVKLKKKDGAVITVLREKLSVDDQKWIRDRSH